MVALVAIVIVAGIVAPAEGSIPRSVDDQSLRAALAAAQRPVATSADPGYRLLARASAGYGLLPRVSARAGSCLSGKRHVGAIDFLAEAQRPGIKEFSLKLAEGVCDGPSMYQFALNNPVDFTDPLGLDAIAIALVDYEITVGERRVPYLGHAAVITIDDSGGTKYFEYGRYDRARIGLTKNRTIPDVELGPNGLPTEESLRNVFRRVLKYAGQESRIQAAYFVTDEESSAKMTSYAWSCHKQNADPERQPYSSLSHNCATFAEDVLEAGGVELPIILDPRPNGRAPVWQSKADFSMKYSPKEDKLRVNESFSTANKKEILEWKALPFWKRAFKKKPH